MHHKLFQAWGTQTLTLTHTHHKPFKSPSDSLTRAPNTHHKLFQARGARARLEQSLVANGDHTASAQESAARENSVQAVDNQREGIATRGHELRRGRATHLCGCCFSVGDQCVGRMNVGYSIMCAFACSGMCVYIGHCLCAMCDCVVDGAWYVCVEGSVCVCMMCACVRVCARGAYECEHGG